MVVYNNHLPQPLHDYCHAQGGTCECSETQHHLHPDLQRLKSLLPNCC